MRLKWQKDNLWKNWSGWKVEGLQHLKVAPRPIDFMFQFGDNRFKIPFNFSQIMREVRKAGVGEKKRIRGVGASEEEEEGERSREVQLAKPDVPTLLEWMTPKGLKATDIDGVQNYYLEWKNPTGNLCS